MGASQRKDAVTYFNEFATAAAAPSSEDFEAHLGLYSAGLNAGSEFFALAQPIVQQLVAHNKETKRLPWLLQHACTVLNAAKESPSGAVPAQVAAIHVVEVTMRHVLAIVKGDSKQLLSLLETEAESSASPAPALCEGLIAFIVNISLDATTASMHAAVAKLLLTLTSSALHHNAAFEEGSMDVFTEMVMASKALNPFLGVLLDRAVAWGAGVVVESAPIYAEGCEPGLRSFLGGMFGGAASRAAAPPPPSGGRGEGGASAGSGGDAQRDIDAVYFSITHEERNAGKNVFSSCLSSERALRHSASLLAVLVAHQKGNGRNPAIDFMTALTNTTAMPFPVILRSLGNRVPDSPAVCMLLYVLLNDHPTFLHDTLRAQQGAILAVVERVLHVTHTCCGAASESGAGPLAAKTAAAQDAAAVDVQEDPLQLDSLGRIERDLTQFSFPFINFMTSTLLLILSQDRVVNQLMCNNACVASFGLDRHQRLGTRLPVASLALQVLCTGIIKAVNDRNEPLATVFAPCMANMAVFAHGLDTYTSQRVVGLLLIMLRKIRLVDGACAAQQQHGNGDAAGAPRRSANPYVVEDAQVLTALGEMLLRQLRMVVESIEGMLCGRDRSNEALIYELLYERDKIIDSGRDEEGYTAKAPSAGGPFTSQAREVLRNITSLIVSYEAEIASASKATSPREIIAVIRRCSQTSAGAAAAQASEAPSPDAEPAKNGAGEAAAADLLYFYEESPYSYDFFGPFVWSTLLSDARWPGGVLWCRRPAAAEDDGRRQGTSAGEAATAAGTIAATTPTDAVTPPLPPGTGAAAVDRVLWDRFTPEPYKVQVAALLTEERDASQTLEDELSAAWQRVEALMTRNKTRRAALSSAALAETLAPVASLLFWTGEEVAQRFALDTDVGGGDDTEVAEGLTRSAAAPQNSSAHIKLDFSVLATRPLAEGQPPSSDAAPVEDETEEGVKGSLGREGTGMHHTRAYSIAERDLLDPCKRPHCLRRLFAPTLRRRHELPKNLGLLLQDVQRVQSGELPRLEELLREVSVMLSVPLHVPFRAIAAVLARELCRPTSTATKEESIVSQLRLGEQLVAELDAYVAAHTADPDALGSLPLEERLALANRMWEMLFDELEYRKALHVRGVQGFEDVTDVAESSYHRLTTSLDACDAESREAMTQLMTDAESCAEAVRRSQARTNSLVGEMDEAFEQNRDRLQAAIDSKAHLLAKSEAAQERLARRVREAVKELHAEQVRYEEAAQELLRDRLSMAQLEASYQQLRNSFHARHEQAQRVEHHTARLKELLQLAEGTRQTLLTACRQHVERVRHDDFYRRCHVMGKVVGNIQGWSRCTQDVGTLYEERFAALAGKARSSWQLSYLVAGEQDWAAGNLLALRPDVSQLRSSWAALQPLLAPLDLAEAERQGPLLGGLSPTGSGAVDERRTRMMLLDGPHAVQRKALTLAQFRARPPQQQQQPQDDTAGGATGPSGPHEKGRRVSGTASQSAAAAADGVSAALAAAEDGTAVSGATYATGAM